MAREPDTEVLNTSSYTTSRMTAIATSAILSAVKRTTGPERKRIREMKCFTVVSSAYVLYLFLLLLCSKVLLACENTPIKQWRK